MTPPRSDFVASPPGGRRQWPGEAGSTASAGFRLCMARTVAEAAQED